MAIWLDDLIEQIGTAMALADSETETGKRLSFITLDNAAEFLMKAYVESETDLVGYEKKLSKPEWEKKKKYFEEVLDFVYANFTLTASKSEITSCHELRNKLYHEGKPLSVSPKIITKYTELFKTLLNDLQKFKMSDDQWRKQAHEVSKMIARKEAQTKIIITYSNESGQTRFITDAAMKDTEAVMFAIHAYSHYFGDEPSFEEIAKILTRSSHALESKVISSRLDHLRKTKKILKTQRLLDPTAVQVLRKKFAIIPKESLVYSQSDMSKG